MLTGEGFKSILDIIVCSRIDFVAPKNSYQLCRFVSCSKAQEQVLVALPRALDQVVECVSNRKSDIGSSGFCSETAAMLSFDAPKTVLSDSAACYTAQTVHKLMEKNEPKWRSIHF